MSETPKTEELVEKLKARIDSCRRCVPRFEFYVYEEEAIRLLRLIDAQAEKLDSMEAAHAKEIMSLNDRCVEIRKKQQAEIERLKSQITNLNEMHDRENKRWLKALEEQGYKVGPLVAGPDIRD